ncbi:uncharacterized protein I303_100162 [Kwoniella dejecticola CBS 10117]|uniref:N-acetyltransferase domain-containing protein n=1 Tax=Kwoniella dejecticola CBS 10117 TaxID=1296121 RepID=A0A1A6AE49_9TREE|nr:uncharacterized protein I303_00163 [Kwoniella dejecticola CBS 10117]OBR88351.1 hypothetical protein I303_00163 [Kwoniella dejecticola CBS 10117]
MSKFECRMSARLLTTCQSNYEPLINLSLIKIFVNQLGGTTETSMISTIHAPEILTEQNTASNQHQNQSQNQPQDLKGKGKAKATESDELDEDRATSIIEPVKLIDDKGDELFYRRYKDEESDLPYMMRLVEQELSEPYNVYTFRYFLIDWPNLAFLVFPSTLHSTQPIATIICKQDSHRGKTNRGYIAMLSVDRAWRRRGIASKLIEIAIDEMTRQGAHEVVLETEYDNAPSLALYDRLGFLREKRLHRFYSNGKDAFRLILPLETDPPPPDETPDEADRGRWAVGAGSEPGPGPGMGLGLGSIREEDEQPLRYFQDTNQDDGAKMDLDSDLGRDGGHRSTPKLPPRPLGNYDWGMYT